MLAHWTRPILVLTPPCAPPQHQTTGELEMQRTADSAAWVDESHLDSVRRRV